MFSLVCKTIYRNICDFLFNVKASDQLGLMRVMLCTALFYLACSRQLNIDQYNLNSIIPRAEALSIYPDFYRPAFQYFFWPDQYAGSIHLIYIGLMFLALIGLSNRFLMLSTWVLAQGFINRNYSMLFGADLTGTLFFFYLSFTDCHDKYSIKPWLINKFSKIKNSIEKKSDQKKESNFSNQLTSVFFRLMQFQIAVIYAYTGFEKLKGSTWWDGTALWTVFANPQFINYDFIFLRNFPLFFTAGTFITLVFEVYFPAMILFKPTRYIWLILGVIFHLGIGFLLCLMPFSMVMISTYFLFIETEHIKLFIQKCTTLRQSYLTRPR